MACRRHEWHVCAWEHPRGEERIYMMNQFGELYRCISCGKLARLRRTGLVPIHGKWAVEAAKWVTKILGEGD